MKEMLMMQKNISEYDFLVFDMDGTLYDQPKMRLIMAFRLVKYYMCHPFEIKDLLAVKKYRQIKEHWDEINDKNKERVLSEYAQKGMEESLCAYTALVMGTSYERVRKVIAKWIYDNPLDVIKRVKDITLAEYISKAQKGKKTIVILSDYPAEDKMKALGIEADEIYCTTDSNIGEMKPSPKGLLHIMEKYKITNDIILMIGDRVEKDGLCAQNAGVDCLILPRSVSKRSKMYKKMLV